jgi:UDP-glucose:(glucosyl)LPS alpha-1,2-glucosyltransferase
LDVEFVPFVATDQLADRYRGASILGVPSMFDEPFGLVAAEAMACRAALVASGRGGLLEVVGNAARHVDPVGATGSAAVIAD